MQSSCHLYIDKNVEKMLQILDLDGYSLFFRIS